MELYKEEDFYQEDGWPTEHFCYSEYSFHKGIDPEWGEDYDEFALVDNALYPYIRLTKKRGNCHIPVGRMSVVPTDGTYARKTDAERDKQCPKIAWGLAAEFLIRLKYDREQDDYVPLVGLNELISGYYKKYWGIYQNSHSGLKYSKISIEQKELDFLKEHIEIERNLWEKSGPLKNYPILYEYACSVVKDYEGFLQGRKQMIENKFMPAKNSFSTEIREVFEKPYVKVFFLVDSVATNAKIIVEALNTVMKVSVTPSKSKAHPGNTLTVYPKPMVDVKECEKEVIESLNKFFSHATVIGGVKPVKNDVLFDDIANGIINDLEKARVSIHVAMAWFTNQRIADKLVEKFKEGLDVKVVSFDHPVNTRFGVNIDAIPHKVIRGTRGGTMHDKFCVVDNQFVITGSYNWSDNAENKNDENVTIMRDYDSASDYSVEFRRLFGS